MITRTDMDFHTPPDAPPDWAETTLFDLHLPHANIHAWVYLCFRAGVGAVLCDITVTDSTSGHVLDVSYIDAQNYLPLPKRMDRFTLPNGLSLDATAGPRDHYVDYVGIDSTEIHIDVRGVMEPYDITDPSIDPMAPPQPEAAAEGSGFGAAYANHFDMTCRITGELVLHGRTIPVDCLSVMDHSWGPRPERGMRAMCWVNANFESDFALHGIFSLNLAAPEGAQHEFRHGYALVDGEVRGAVGGALVARRDGRRTLAVELALEDAAGRRYRAEGAMRTYRDWLVYPNLLAPMHMMEWSTEGRDAVGHGSHMEAWPLGVALLTGARVNR